MPNVDDIDSEILKLQRDMRYLYAQREHMARRLEFDDTPNTMSHARHYTDDNTRPIIRSTRTSADLMGEGVVNGQHSHSGFGESLYVTTRAPSSRVSWSTSANARQIADNVTTDGVTGLGAEFGASRSGDITTNAPENSIGVVGRSASSGSGDGGGKNNNNDNFGLFVPVTAASTGNMSSAGGNAGGNSTPNTVISGSSPGTVGGNRRRKPMALEKYDGSTPLATFLAKLDICAKYNEWDADEKAAFLCNSLSGPASQVLWELKGTASDTDVIALLRQRFGTANAVERYRAELRARRRKPGESIETLYTDIRRLMALAFPGHSGELYEVLGRDALLEALGDNALRIRVMDQDPKTIDEVLQVVGRMEAYTAAVEKAKATDSVDQDHESPRKKVRYVGSPERGWGQASKRISELEARLQQQQEEIVRLKSGGTNNHGGGNTNKRGNKHGHSGANKSTHLSGGGQQNWAPVVNTPAVGFSPTPAYTTPPQQWQGGAPASAGTTFQQPRQGDQSWALPQQYNGVQSGIPSGPGFTNQANALQQSDGGYNTRSHTGKNRLPRDVCARCAQKGHWWRECPYPGTSPQNMESDYVHGVDSTTDGKRHRTETYVEITAKGKTIPVLLDTGWV